MKRAARVIILRAILCKASLLLSIEALANAALKEQNEKLFTLMSARLQLTPEQLTAVRKIIESGPFIGQGNPAVARRPMTEAECHDRAKAAGINFENVEFQKICGAPYMAPLFDPQKEKAEQAKVCIDQFEFPNIPCTYPVVWTRANEAAQICEAMGKRLCDAHEWEGACEGQLLPPDYDFAAAKGKSMEQAVKAMRQSHNRQADKAQRWTYGAPRRKGVCAMNSVKSEGCDGGNWQKCGSNTYPSGSFTECRGSLQVYDIHGNAAEHMSLPLAPEELGAVAGKSRGVTEMKGSWFIWDKYEAHPDFCRWRAPFWHGSRVMHPDSHHNYHLGFRCCKDVQTVAP